MAENADARRTDTHHADTNNRRANTSAHRTNAASHRGGKNSARRAAQQAERAQMARQHTNEMAERFSAEIKRTLDGMRRFDGIPKQAQTPEPRQAQAPESGQASALEQDQTPTQNLAEELPHVTIVDQDSVTAVLERGRGRAELCDLAVLDFASFTHPGGGYDRGTMAQEESLCAESFLYNCLSACKDWYAQNRRHNINCELYRERGLVLPKVRFERDRYHSYADVIVVAAPNARRARAAYKVGDKDLNAAMRRRIRFVLSIADELGHDKLILGAFGCGVFGWNASVVAQMFLDELTSGAHRPYDIVFAIPSGRYDDNLARFQHAFAKYPEVNEEPYAPASASQKTRSRSRQERQDQAAGDEGEEDWRKYL